MKYVVSSTAWQKSIWQREPNVEEDILLSFESGAGFSLLRIGGGLNSWKLVAFADSWKNLPQIAPLLDDQHAQNFDTEEMVSALRELGFRPDFDYHGQLGNDYLNVDELTDAALDGNKDAIYRLSALAHRLAALAKQQT